MKRSNGWSGGMDDGTKNLILNRAVRLCQQGNRNEFNSIVDLFDRRLYGTALLITGDPGHAEDATQETFVRAWTRIKSLSDPSKLQAWLMRILFNYLKDQKRKKYVPQVGMEAAMSVEDQTGGADRRTLNRESSAEIFSVMSTLPEDQRTVLALRYYEELSLDEIVEVTGWRLGTVKSRIFRGLRNSKKRLEEPTHLRLVGEPSKPGKEGVG
ncbi:MAG: sigma-70 family RNA polymerase sigma factor [Chloroflexi bacterium]|jgi:RNA polymerase sigma-70 factor, ECF subfamily|nr:sigma-70 family RNA polymerase sigma factor [Chloroflexota bacterium]MBT5626758.1 sigma-70 family RNA polymerase sigma factor [Chloroflexota bacterium]